MRGMPGSEHKFRNSTLRADYCVDSGKELSRLAIETIVTTLRVALNGSG